MTQRAPRHDPAAAIAAAAAMAPVTAVQRVPLADLAGRRLADALRAPRDVPAHDASAMDGWALAAHPAPAEFTLVGESAPGVPFAGALGPGQACRISTGALLPEGADAVLRREDGRVHGDRLSSPGVRAGRDVRGAGSEARQGALLLPAGRVLTAHEVGVAAATGVAWLPCHAPPRLALLATGTELVDGGGTLERGQVVDSNRPMLTALVHQAGGAVVRTSRIPDRADDLRRAVQEALDDRVDVILTVGGASLGTHDHVRTVLREMGAQAVSDGFAMRPGRPGWLGRVAGTPLLALPGNPGAAMTVFCLLGRALLGLDDAWVPVPLAAPLQAAGDSDRFLRCALGPEGIRVGDDQGPGSTPGLASVDALVWVPAGTTAHAAGSHLRTMRLR